MLFLSLIGFGRTQSLPDGKGRAQLQRICGTCHGIDVATKPRLSEEQWAAVVDEMVGRGAQGTDDEFELIVKYLATNFGKHTTDSESRTAAGQKIDVNTASALELAGALDLSKSDAERIVRYRKDKGAFRDWPDLRKVPDINLKKIEDQKDRIVFMTLPAPRAKQEVFSPVKRLQEW